MGPLVTAGLGLFQSFLSGRQKISEAKADIKIQRMQNGIPGYTDDILMLIWATPFVMSFIPGLDTYAVAGFKNLDELPNWYVGGFISISFAVFGIDKLFSWKK